MTCHNLDMIPALRALCQIGTAGTDLAATLIFPVSVTIRCTVSQHFVIGSDITVIILIIYILILFEESFLMGLL